MRKDKPYAVHVVSATHWDRAWYQPFEQFRIRLVEVMDHLLGIFARKPGFKHFTFDGQTVVLEDYLEIHPEKEEVLRSLVKRGKLLVGPSYVLPDEYLVSGESLIRNLLIGWRIAQRFGRVMRIGYMPDSFGHVAQMPQILRGFGLDNFIFTRGMGDEADGLGSEFTWIAPDGRSSVLAIHQIGGYANARSLGVPYRRQPIYKADFEQALRESDELVQLLKRFARTRVLLFNNGLDHDYAQAEIAEIIEYVNERRRGSYRLHHSTFERFLNALKRQRPRLRTFTGELHGSKYHWILSGVYSARIHLKQRNQQVQALLERYLEPMLSLSWLEGDEYPEQLARYCWKLLLRNHPHDDICGCGVDAIHRDMENRFDRAEAIAQFLIGRKNEDIFGRIHFRNLRGAVPFIVYNPLGWRRGSAVAARLSFPAKQISSRSVSVVDCNNRPTQMAVRSDTKRKRWHPWEAETMRDVEVEILASDLPASGYKVFYLVAADAARQIKKSDLRVLPNGMENQFYRVLFNRNGSMNIADKETGLVLRGCHFFEDVADAGDTYDFSPLRRDRAQTLEKLRARISLVENLPHQITYSVKVPLRVPQGLREDRKKRSRRFVTLNVETRVTLFSQTKRVDFETSLENRAQDHRLRVVFPVPFSVDVVDAESCFDVCRRPVLPRPLTGWMQPPLATHHQANFASLSNGTVGVTFIAKGLPEYEVREEKRGVRYYLTLFRAVGWLSRGDLLTRPDNAGPQLPAPEAQMLRAMRFEYALTTHAGDWETSRSYRAAYEHNHPALAMSLDYDPMRPERAKSLPEELSIVALEPEDLVVSALKKAEDRASLSVRCFNPMSKGCKARLRLYRPARGAYVVNLNEARQRRLQLVNGGKEIHFTIRAKEILTFEFVFRS